MKYVALVYNNPGVFEALSETERNELMAAADAYLKQITESGELRRAGPRGRRQPVLPDGVRLQLELLDQRRFGGGTVYLRYRVSPAATD